MPDYAMSQTCALQVWPSSGSGYYGRLDDAEVPDTPLATWEAELDAALRWHPDYGRLPGCGPLCDASET